jgi:dihydrolipoamide dehydrogenase
MAENEGRDGICKVLYDNQSQRILGIHIISSYASEIIHSAAMMIESKMTIMDTDRFVFPHPTVSEIISDTILS